MDDYSSILQQPLDKAPQGATITCTPKRRVLQALLLATAKKRLPHYLLFLILPTVLLYC